jgi:iron complex outermembrane receptor protein
MRKIRRDGALFRAGLLITASASSMLLASPALAQDADPAAAAEAPPQDDQTEANQEPAGQPEVGASSTSTAVDQNAIVVTGSRIKQPEFTSADPVARIDPVIAQRQGKLDVASSLQSSPIAAGSTQITSAISSNFVTNGGPGSQTIDLRGLGANRTLVLLNGRRAGPAGTRGGVSSFDLNVLPQSIVSRIDILKTGASSVYGSDAVAGVVNLITKTDFDGIQVDAFANVPTKAGGEQFDASVLWGKKFDRGHVMIALDYFKQNELNRGQRKYLDCPEANVYKRGSKQRADLIDPRTGKYACIDLPVGQVWTYDYEYNYLYGVGNLRLPDGRYVGPVNLVQYQYPGENLGLPPITGSCGDYSCFSAPPGWFFTGYDAASQAVQNNFNPFASEVTIIPKTERYTLYADAAYELTDNIEAYVEFLGNRRKTYQNGYRQFWTFGFTGDYGGYWAQDWHGLNLLSPTAVTNRGSDSKQKVDYWRGVGGLRGDLGGILKNWSYDAYVQYSHNKGLYSNEQILQDVIDYSYFQSASCVGQVLPFSGKQCRDLPWTDPYFLMGQISPEDADYLFDWETGKTIYKQLSGEASLSGPLFHLPAGTVSAAFGLTARRDSILDTPGDITYIVNPYYDPTIAPGSSICRNSILKPCNANISNAWGNTAAGITSGHTITKEVFGELQVPLLRDVTMFKDLSLNAAARLTDVRAEQGDTGIKDHDAGNWTYKVGANWAVNDWLRFRGTYGTSFRAPALFELFKANETSFVSARTNDPCRLWGFNLQQGNISQRIADNCASQGIPANYGGGAITATIFSKGGIGQLDPETSKAMTASVILTPRFAALPNTRMSFAVDYFKITVKDEVSQLGASTITFGCYSSDNFPNDPLCQLFNRGAFGTDPFALTEIYDQYINIASQVSKGVDFTALIQQGLGRFGSLTLLGNATVQLKDQSVLLKTSPLIDNNGDIGDPKFVADLNATWRPGGGWTLFWGTEIYGKASNERKFRDAHGGDLCNQSVIYGEYCVDVKVPTTFYHSASVTKEFGSANNKFEFTLGIRNMFDTRPPRVSTIGGTGLPGLLGPVVATSQYDFLGRRIFLNVSKKF